MERRESHHSSKNPSRKQRHGRRLSLAIAAAALALPLCAQPVLARRTPDVRLLMIGNSFSHGINSRLKSLIRSAGLYPRIKIVAKNGATLADHAASPATLRRIYSEPWDYVVLQEQSLGEFAMRYPYARVLDAHATANGSQTMFLMTWRDRGEPLAAYDSLRGSPGEEVGYVPIASELGAPLAPVGWAFRNAIEDRVFTDLWSRDGHHANDGGRYLAACVLYATLFGESPEGLWAPGSLGPVGAAYYQNLAAATVFAESEVWQLRLAPRSASGAGVVAGAW